MKITAITAPSGADFGLNAAFKIVCDTLIELGEEIKSVNLSMAALPYHNGANAADVQEIMVALRDADAVVFAMPSVFSAPCAMMMGFVEYFENEEYRDVLSGKNCMILAISQNGGERRALEILANSLAALNAHDVVSIALNTSVATVVKKQIIELIERQAEDFYRIIRQNRKYVAATPVAPALKNHLEASNEAIADITKIQAKTASVNIEELYKKHSLDAISNEAQDDINRITNLFAQKYISSENSITEDAIVPIAASVPAKTAVTTTCRQLTGALPHYFNPHLAKDVNATVQLDITGTDGFSGHLVIDGHNCEFFEGKTEKSDIIVVADSIAWTDVLRKKVTAQKAFMMGQLKVRGNFVLLGKFDQLFNKIP